MRAPESLTRSNGAEESSPLSAGDSLAPRAQAGSRDRARTHLPLRTSLPRSCAVGVAALFALALAHSWSLTPPSPRGGSGPGTTSPTAAQESPLTALAEESGPAGLPAPLVRVSTGPNDGEPISGRVVPLRLWTNFAEAADLGVAVQGVHLGSVSWLLARRWDAEEGAYICKFDVDLEDVAARSRRDLLSPDAGPLRITVSLYPHATRSLLAYGDWVGYYGRPWIEVLRTPVGQLPLGEGGQLPGVGLSPDPRETEMEVGAWARSARQARLHAAPLDLYYFLVASPDRELLRLSPDDPRLLRQGRVLASGGFAPDTAHRLQALVPLDGLVTDSTPILHLVLWTLGSTGGWQRSPIETVVGPN